MPLSASRHRFTPRNLVARAACRLGLLAGLVTAMNAAVGRLEWQALPPLPPGLGQSRQAGVASPFVGVHDNVLIVAGGANFPDRMPWDGGAKVWWDDIWVLQRDATGRASWVEPVPAKLPRPLGYGLSVSTPQGVICVGGSDAEQCYTEVFCLAWDAASRTVRRTPLPSLPEPLANMAGALVGQTLYVAGGQHTMKGARPSSAFWSLDLARLEGHSQTAWKRLPTWPGPARILPVAAAQGPADAGRFYLFSGRRPEPGQPTQILTDAYAYDPRTEQWTPVRPVGGGKGVSVMAGTAAAVGETEILVFGGDRGDLFLQLERHDLAIEGLRSRLATASSTEKPGLQARIDEQLAAKREIYARHPGFGSEVWCYDTVKDAWRVLDQSPVPPQVTTLAVRWGRDIVIPSGEIRPGVRTTAVHRIIPLAP